MDWLGQWAFKMHGLELPTLVKIVAPEPDRTNVQYHRVAASVRCER
jgi:hypothetical protein